ncbi:hypothetical protein [Winogradskyella bathintestinalis]|uniref:Uncharacterized protein n=1 Tax=Winogradskyella bathintestinalis TaxID=3035208 RepID=A0ABT7ZXU9_9FLAO|nr:hypothetical protein [Winogradskyella bathintestinalis]MDN3493831.1 hypothetical protein [Winogradskyella bathintestinalis]
MIKNICTLVILLVAVNNYGQNITLLKNNNPKAKDLSHQLNAAKDSILLACKTKILQVDIFNEDFEKIIIIDNYEAKIYLGDIPEGKFVLETKLEDKVVLIGLMRHTDLQTSEIHYNKDINEGKGMMLDESLKVITKVPNKSIAFILTGSKPKHPTYKNQKFYWAVRKINTKSGANRTMQLLDKTSVDRMILKHKEQLKRVAGRHSELMIWEVYDTSKFMEHQVSNPDFFYSLNSDLFNTIPYYSTNNKVVNL